MAKRKPEIFDLDDYEIVKSAADADLIIQTQTRADGSRLAPVMYKYTKVVEEVVEVAVNRAMIDSEEGVEWNPHIFIDTQVEPEEYIYIIGWWFREASKDENKYFFDRQTETFPDMDVPLAVKAIRKSLEGYHAYHSSKKVKDGKVTIVYPNRIKDVGKKITTMLNKYHKQGWYRK